MTGQDRQWNGETVRAWLESRLAAARFEQDRADRMGRGHEDDYDKAAAEEWACRAATGSETVSDQTRFGGWIEELLGRDEYPRTGIYDDRRFEREVRSCLRKLRRMAKTNTGFDNRSRYQ